MLTMLSNFSSLWEVFTAFYCSMLIDNILGFIWTPPYKKNVKGLILNMGIPFVEILSEKLSHQLEENFNGINSHMKKKAIFMLAFCICLLILSGAEQNFGFTKDNITEICFWLSLFALIIIFTGKYTFQNTSVRLKSHHNESCIVGSSERLLLSSLVTLNMEWISLCLNRSGPIAFEIA